jgi:hypothetical protein
MLLSEEQDSFYVDGFENAADGIRRWLQGDECARIRSHMHQSIVEKPGNITWESDDEIGGVAMGWQFFSIRRASSPSPASATGESASAFPY